MKTLEDIYKAVGGFGRLQFMSLAVIMAPEWSAAMIEFQPIFTAADPLTWTCTDSSGLSMDVTNDSVALCACNGTLDGGSNTIVAEWHLICDKAWVADFITSVQMAGFVLGDIFAPLLADRFGRKIALYTFCLVLMMSSLLSAFAPGPILYACARFVSGGGVAAILILGAIYPIEFLTPRFRPLCGAIGPWGEGVLCLALWAWLFPQWRHLCVAISLPLLLIFPTYAFMAESPRWLLTRGKHDEARKVIDTIAKWNRKPPISQNSWNEYLENVDADLKDDEEVPNSRSKIDLDLELQKNEIQGPEISERIESHNETPKEIQARNSNSVPKWGILDFLKTPGYIKKTWVLSSLWFTSCFIYYGIGFNTKYLSGDPYLNVVFMALLDMAGFHSAIFVSGWLGRRRSITTFMGSASLLLIGLIFMEFQWGSMHLHREEATSFDMTFNILSFGGRMCSAATLSVVECFTSESFPTQARATAAMLANFAASFAAVLAPQMAFFGTVYKTGPYFVFAFFALLSTVSNLLLKETKGKPLP